MEDQTRNIPTYPQSHVRQWTNQPCRGVKDGSALSRDSCSPGSLGLQQEYRKALLRMEPGSALGSVTSMSNVLGPLHSSSVRCSGSCWVTLFSNIYPGREQIYIVCQLIINADLAPLSLPLFSSHGREGGRQSPAHTVSPSSNRRG